MRSVEEQAVRDAEIDEIYDAIDVLMRSGNFNFLNSLFPYWTSTAWRTSVHILLTYATASLPAKSKLPSRKAFMEECMKLHTEPKLWSGLE